MRNIVIVGLPPVQILDVTGPLEVFANAPNYSIQLATTSHGRMLQTNRGIDLGPAIPASELRDPIDTLLVAGGPGAERGTFDPASIQWIADAAKRARRVASICTGA